MNLDSVDVRTYVRYFVRMNATKLRSELYAVLDSILSTGKPVIIHRKGERLVLMREAKTAAKSKRRWPKAQSNFVNGDVEDLVHIDWSKEWKP